MRKIALALATASTIIASPALAKDDYSYVGIEAGAVFPGDIEADDGTDDVAFIEVGNDWNIDTAYQIRYERTGFSGGAIRLAKRVVRPFVRLYTDHILNRQAQINLVVWHFLLDSTRRTLLLELEIKKLQSEIDTLKRSR